MPKKCTMTWDQAVLKVLKDNKRSMRYDEIADVIISQELRASNELGSTPAMTVNAILHGKIRDHVVCVRRGEFILKDYLKEDPTLAADVNSSVDDDDEDNEMDDALITAYGRFWDRKLWEENGMQILGSNTKTRNADSADFTQHAGIYLLHKGYQVIYVGQAKHLVKRLEDHTKDDKRNRWDNFSWFSIDDVDQNSSPENAITTKTLEGPALLDTLEALLIETLGPERNKKVGNDFDDKEFEQIPESEYYKRKCTK